MKKSGILYPFIVTVCIILSPVLALAEGYITDSGTFGMKIYAVNSAFYPFVMAYIRTMDTQKEPLANMTPMNVGLMVKGRAYDPYKKQYIIQTLKERTEGFRTVLVIDACKEMRGQPFRDAIDAARTYIRLKSPSDEIAIIALQDEAKIMLPFTKDGVKADLFLNDIQPTARKAPIMDGIGRAIQMCATAAGTTSTGSTDYVVLSNILVISAGEDRGSAVTKDNLMTKIMDLKPPFPIYVLGWNKVMHEGLKNLAALSEASFGRFWQVNKSSDFGQLCNKIQEINRHDYVITFRGYLPVDGMKHNMKVVIKYEDKLMTDSREFETMEVPLLSEEQRRVMMYLQGKMPALPDGNPYVSGSTGMAQ